jgi:GR25 family glycosyltransferase involved in LPS biosynthesis
MNKFFINLNRCADRLEYFDDTWTRWEATDWKDLDSDDPIFSRMLSMWNIRPEEHKAKCACWLSHINLLQHVVDNGLHDVLVVEDDAEQINKLPDDLGDEFCYLGGFFMGRLMTKGAVEPPSLVDGSINSLPSDYQLMTSLAYYIPTPKIANSILNEIITQKRYRAIDVMFNKVSLQRNVYSPAIFRERPLESQIRASKKKHASANYTFETHKKRYSVVIPSYQRFEKLKKYSLKYLDKHCIPHSDIIIVIRNDDVDFDKYITLREQGYQVISTDIKGIGNTHNFITKKMYKNQVIIEIDDDLKKIVDETRTEILSFDYEMTKIIDKMNEEKVNYAGLYSVANPLFMSGQPKYTTDLRYMLGILRIRRVCKDIKLETNYSEDMENCILHYIRDGKLLKCNHLAGITQNYSKGGCDGDGRNQETEKTDKEFIANKYPQYCRLFQRKNGKWDCRLKEYKK